MSTFGASKVEERARVFEPGDDADLKEYIIDFPMRSDTFLVFNASGEKVKEIQFTNNYSILLIGQRVIDKVVKYRLDRFTLRKI